MLDLQMRTFPEHVVLDLAGPLGREGGEAVLHTVQRLSPLPARLVLNFSRVESMSTAGLGGVLWAVRLITKAGNQVFAYGLTDHFRKVFHVMGLTQFIAVVEDEATALRP